MCCARHPLCVVFVIIIVVIIIIDVFIVIVFNRLSTQFALKGVKLNPIT